MENNEYTKEELARREKILAERREARKEKLLKDQQILEFHAKIGHMMEGPEARELKEKALEICDIWEKKKICSAYYINAWRRILSMPLKNMRKAMLSEKSIGFRQNSPFFWLYRKI